MERTTATEGHRSHGRTGAVTLALLLWASLGFTQSPPTAITIVDPSNLGSDHRGPNPIRERDVTFHIEHPCDDCRFDIYHDDATEPVPYASTNLTTPKPYTWTGVTVGEHRLEVRDVSAPCPPVTVQPTQCSRYIAFTVLPDGSIIAAPTGLRIVR